MPWLNCGRHILVLPFHTFSRLPHLLLHLAWQPNCFYQSKHEAGHSPMDHKEGDGPTSKCKIV